MKKQVLLTAIRNATTAEVDCRLHLENAIITALIVATECKEGAKVTYTFADGKSLVWLGHNGAVKYVENGVMNELITAVPFDKLRIIWKEVAREAIKMINCEVF